jgi:hypothetical protein
MRESKVCHTVCSVSNQYNSAMRVQICIYLHPSNASAMNAMFATY